ncbi:MAG: GNAT family N-acetyltransferase [Pseudoruegeria sp.]
MPFSMSTYEFRTLSPQATLALRQAVLWPEKPIADLTVPNDETALHLGLFIKDQHIGVASFFPDNLTVRLRKMAIANSHQGRGLGATLLQEGAHRLKHDGYRELWCDARVNALGFYQKLGFNIDPDRFEKSGLIYQVARLNLITL